MREILPGVHHWTNLHPKIGVEVSSYWIPASKAVIDPLLSEGQALDEFRGDPPDRVLLTNRHHLRSSERFAAELGCTIHCHLAGLHEFENGPEVEGFEWGQEVAPGIEALEVDAICDEETALLVAEPRALSVADAVMHYGDELSFVPDGYIGEDPETVKAAIREACGRLLDRDFDNLLFAHGEPLLGGAREALRDFCG